MITQEYKETLDTVVVIDEKKERFKDKFKWRFDNQIDCPEYFYNEKLNQGIELEWHEERHWLGNGYVDYGRFDVSLNGKNVDKLPIYRQESNRPNLWAKSISVNNKQIIVDKSFAYSMPWFPELIQNRIDKALLRDGEEDDSEDDDDEQEDIDDIDEEGQDDNESESENDAEGGDREVAVKDEKKPDQQLNQFIESFQIIIGKEACVDSDVINGLIGRILMQDTPFYGFKEIALCEFGQGIGELDLGVLNKLVDQS